MTGGGSIATLINESGQVAGEFDFAAESNHAFVWTRTGGAVDLGILGGPESFTVATNDAGQVAGNSTPSNAPERLQHAFVWDRNTGMLDLGTLGGNASNAAAMNNAGQVVGIAARVDGVGHAFLWDKSRGMVDLGTLGGQASRANAINNSGQVGGFAETASANLRAFLWSPARGMVDLNTLIPDAPPGLLLTEVLAIADSGAMLVASNAGLVLLNPGSAGTSSPVVGPISPTGPVNAGTEIAFSVPFADKDKDELLAASWRWGDGSADTAGTVTAANGAGSATGHHVFATPGVYLVLVTLTDNAGLSTTVGSYIEAR